MNVFAAVDLGASSGRVILGRLRDGGLRLREVHRFANEPVRLPDGLHWDITGLYRDVLHGLRRSGAATSIGVDSWAVDYGLLDAAGRLVGLPYHYRDSRTDGLRVPVAPGELYRTTGIQHLPFNTIYQLLADGGPPGGAATLLLIPDLLGYWLTGQVGAERTNASTTGLYDVRTGDWSAPLVARLGLPADLLPPLRDPGLVIGPLLPHVRAELGGNPMVLAVGSHDTASAVAAIPAAGGGPFAYISCGTWSLVGVELAAPVLTEASRAANFSNETGVGGTIRYLRNVMGLWLLQECERAWSRAGDTAQLLAEAAAAVPFAALIDADDPVFLPPGDMPARIDAYCTRTGQRPPTTHGGYVRCIAESLALGHRAAIRAAAELSGQRAEFIHLVGGGARNHLLCQLTADATGLPVVAGPVEATAIGNILVQALAAGALPDLAAGRAIVRNSANLCRYNPRGDESSWDRAATRLAGR
jgi:rhamnulokinase